MPRRSPPVCATVLPTMRSGVAESFSVLECDHRAASRNLPGTSSEFCPGTDLKRRALLAVVALALAIILLTSASA